MNEPKLIVGMIGDKCSDTLPLCLDSFIKEVDKLCFVWGTECEKTLQIIGDYKNQYPDKIEIIKHKYPHEDKGANGKQRGIYLEWVQKNYMGEYILVLDPDEVVDNISLIRKKINELANNPYIKDKYQTIHFKMRHLINTFGHEDFTNPNHIVFGRLFKIKPNLFYPKKEHPLIESTFKEGYKTDEEMYRYVHLEYLQKPVFWHLGYAKQMFDIYKKYKNHQKKSQVHSPEYLKWWYQSHLFGEYPIKRVHPLELPKIIKDYFELNIEEELYFKNRLSMEEKHWTDAYQWKSHFKPKSCLVVGAGVGQRVFTMNALDVDTYGFDISKIAIENTPYKDCKSKLFVDNIVNLKHKGQYDLVVCYDVMEHIEEKDVDNALKNLYNLTKKNILFGITYKENPNINADPTHITKKPGKWWLEKIKGAGFKVNEAPEYFLFRQQLIIGTKNEK